MTILYFVEDLGDRHERRARVHIVGAFSPDRVVGICERDMLRDGGFIHTAWPAGTSPCAGCRAAMAGLVMAKRLGPTPRRST